MARRDCFSAEPSVYSSLHALEEGASTRRTERRGGIANVKAANAGCSNLKLRFLVVSCILVSYLSV